MMIIKMIVKEIMITMMIVMMMMMIIIITITIIIIIVKAHVEHILFRSTYSNSFVSTERKIRYPRLELQSKFSRHCL